MPTPPDADARRAVPPVICYPTEALPPAPLPLYAAARATARTVAEVIVPPREARAIRVPAGSFLLIDLPEGAQVGDLNLFSADNPDERFFSGKTRALHGTHVTVGDRLWSCLPFLRPMATITADSLGWYGTDAYGGRVHDVIGTRCDPYTHHLLSGGDAYHHCCHSNLTRAMMAAGFAKDRAEALVHDVLNVFMCTGFTPEGRYFMKASPARAGDHLEMLAEIDLMAVLSACPGGDCSATHSSDAAVCHPMRMVVLQPDPGALADWAPPPPSGYDRSHGLG
jgi:uncharacterized protein YcgI (DUF1989 family)